MNPAMPSQPPAVDPELQAKIQALKGAIADPPPFCSGILALKDNAFRLMYGKNEPQRKCGCVLVFLSLLAALLFTDKPQSRQFSERGGGRFAPAR